MFPWQRAWSDINRQAIYTLSPSFFRKTSFSALPTARNIFERSLETMRIRYHFVILGYVVMPEHVHLLVSEPKNAPLSKAIQALKLSVAVQRSQRPFWQARSYDFNVFTNAKRVEKLKYVRRNPVARGLVPNRTRGHGPASGITQWASGTVRIGS